MNVAPPEDYDFEKLAREIVASRLAGAENAAPVVAEIAKKIIITGVSSTKVRQNPRATVAAVCRGLLGGLLLLDLPLADSAVAILHQMAGISADVPLDPGDLMTWGMEGMADVARLAGADAQSKIQDAIEAEFQGAGSVFGKLCAPKAP